jgi:DNA-3-methyladenine glycosylase I
MKELTRCGWAVSDPLMMAYHDEEWGVPVRDDRVLFEFLILEGAQAGLSWSTILKRRESYREAFAGFDLEAVARFNAGKVEALMGNAGVIRNRLKIEGAVKNARASIAVRQEYGSLGGVSVEFRGREADCEPASAGGGDSRDQRGV